MYRALEQTLQLAFYMTDSLIYYLTLTIVDLHCRILFWYTASAGELCAGAVPSLFRSFFWDAFLESTLAGQRKRWKFQMRVPQMYGPYDSGNLHMISWMLNTNIDKFYAVASNLKMSGILKRCFLKPFGKWCPLPSFSTLLDPKNIGFLGSDMFWYSDSGFACTFVHCCGSSLRYLRHLQLGEVRNSNFFFLVGGWATPLKNMISSIGMMRFPIYGKMPKMATKPPTSFLVIPSGSSHIGP